MMAHLPAFSVLLLLRLGTMHNSSLDLIDSVEKLQEALSHWKNTTFSQHYLKLEDVVASFDTPELRLVNARQEFAPRWLVSPIPSHRDTCVTFPYASSAAQERRNLPHFGRREFGVGAPILRPATTCLLER